MEIWLDNPVTKTYLQCLEWSAEQVSEVLGNEGLIDSENNDHTSNAIHSALGKKRGLLDACDPSTIITLHEMLELPKEEDEE